MATLSQPVLAPVVKIVYDPSQPPSMREDDVYFEMVPEDLRASSISCLDRTHLLHTRVLPARLHSPVEK